MTQAAANQVGLVNGVLDFDPVTFRTHYNRAAFQFSHRFVDQPLLSVPALLKLARRLPVDNVHQHRADIKINEDFYNAAKYHPTNQTIEETMRILEVPGSSYVMLTNPTDDPEYAELLSPLWEEVGELVDPLDPGRCDHMSFIFISSPRAVTPFHVDRVANFHLQVQGEKVIQLWDPFDRVVLTDADLSHVVAEPRTYHAPYKPAFQSRAQNFAQKPGLGVHHPWGAPHAVEVGPNVSVSIAITFRSRAMKRRIELHEVNHQLRRLGLRPREVGQSPWRDSLTFMAFRLYRGVKRVLRGGGTGAE